MSNINEIYALAIAKNGTVEPTSIIQLSVYVKNIDGTSDAEFESYNLNIVGV